MSDAKSPRRETAARQAAQWLVTIRGAPDESQQAEFFAWLKKSPLHVEEYLCVARAHGELRALARQIESSAILVPKDPLRAQRARALWTYAAAAAVLGVIALGLLWWRAPGGRLEQVRAEHFATRHGEQRSERFADGSLAYLDTDTSITVLYRHAERGVSVESGRVLFEVAHDASRPFRVRAGAAEVVAVGTRFDVYVEAGATLVTVVEGQVAVGLASKAGASNETTRRSPLLVAANQQVHIVDGQLPTSASPVDAQRATGWLRRHVSFDHRSLAEVVNEFNRYSSVPIVIETPELGSLMISGEFSVDDTESFIAFLRSLDGIAVQETPTRIRVYKN